MIGLDRLQRYRKEINKSFQNFLLDKDERFIHITSLPNEKMLINVFTYEVPKVLANTEPIIMNEIQASWYYRFMFPVAKVVASGNSRIPVGSIVGISPLLTMMMYNPQHAENKKLVKEEPRPEITEAPEYTRMIEFDEEWLSKQYYDPFVTRKKEDSLYSIMDYSVTAVYNESNLLSLDPFIDGKI